MPVVADATTRFTSRTKNYVAARPSYPSEVVALLSQVFDIPFNGRLVDLGSGTGLLSAILLNQLQEQAVSVVGVEPNDGMRDAGEEYMDLHMRNGNFLSVDATAEATGLPDRCVDVVVAGQAFHWFDAQKARRECMRILKPGRTGVALIWNERRGMAAGQSQDFKPTGDLDFEMLDSPVMSAFDLLLVRRAKEYQKVGFRQSVDAATLNEFFGPEGFKAASFPNPYKLTFEQLKSRLLSSSYTPEEGQEGHDAMLLELKELFEEHKNAEGKIDFLYATRVIYGQMSGA